MTANEGTADRAVRAVAGIAILVIAWMWLGLAVGALLGVLAAVVGVVLLVTAVVGFCPAYRMVGMSTCKLKGA